VNLIIFLIESKNVQGLVSAFRSPYQLQEQRLGYLLAVIDSFVVIFVFGVTDHRCFLLITKNTKVKVNNKRQMFKHIPPIIIIYRLILYDGLVSSMGTSGTESCERDTRLKSIRTKLLGNMTIIDDINKQLLLIHTMCKNSYMHKCMLSVKVVVLFFFKFLS
jgi:hypothetical protein